MIFKISVLLLLGVVLRAAGQENEMDAKPRYVEVPSGYLVVLRQGDDILKSLEALAVRESIPSANFTGMGFVNVTFGFFDFSTKKYQPKDFRQVELVSMHGTIAWKEGKPSIHAHGSVTDKTFRAFGGHILQSTVSTGSVEILLIPHDKKLERKEEQDIGADVLQLDTVR